MNFDQMGKQHVSRRRKPSPLRNTKPLQASFDGSFSQDVWPRPSQRNTVPNRQGTARSSSGFSIPLSWVKNLAIAAGVLVIGVVGTNWDSIATNLRLYEVSPRTLQDTAAYQIMDAAYQPVIIPETDAVVSFEDIPLDLTETFSWTEYRIQQGDTISGVAARFSISAESIIAFNNIKEAWNIRIGSTLKIPNMNGIPYTVGKNDSLSKIATKMKVPQNAILDANNLQSATIHQGEVLFIPGAHMDATEFSSAYRKDANRRDGSRGAVERPMILPALGKLTSGFGWREDPVRPIPGQKRFHQGVDFGGKIGDPVKAAMSGTVLHVDNNPNLGKFMILKHDSGYQTLYAHLSAYSVAVGTEVRQGQEIGKIGDTGYTTGPHLHFEAFRNGNRVNPLDLLK